MAKSTWERSRVGGYGRVCATARAHALVGAWVPHDLVLTGYSWGAHGALTQWYSRAIHRYSRRTRRVLTKYSRGSQRVFTLCSKSTHTCTRHCAAMDRATAPIGVPAQTRARRWTARVGRCEYPSSTPSGGAGAPRAMPCSAVHRPWYVQVQVVRHRVVLRRERPRVLLEQHLEYPIEYP